ncbi:MAG: energy transducer TonB [Candidatus Omnitrophota bacterium]
MNRTIILPGFLSVSVHAVAILTHIVPFSAKDLDANLPVASTSMEISMVRAVPRIEVRTEPAEEKAVQDVSVIEEASFTESLVEEEFQDVEEEAVIEEEVPDEPVVPPETPSDIGVVQEQISRLLTNKPPQYPRVARINGWSGEVVLLASVNTDGSCRKVAILSGSGHRVLDFAAVKAVRLWRFKDVSKAVEVKVPVVFILTR